MRCIRCRCRFDPVDGLRESDNDPNCALLIAVAALGLSACTNPYDPVPTRPRRGHIGSGFWCRHRAAAGGGPGAALGERSVGATGIFGGVASTPPPPSGTYSGLPSLRTSCLWVSGLCIPATQPGYGNRVTGKPPYPLVPAMDIQDTRALPVPRAMGTRAHRAADPPAPPGYGDPSHLENPTDLGSPDYERRAKSRVSCSPRFAELWITRGIWDASLILVPGAMAIRAIRLILPSPVSGTTIPRILIRVTPLPKNGVPVLGTA